MSTNKSYLLGIYTKSPLHVGSGTSVDIVDLPIARERITNYPVIPGAAIKGVLRQHARDCGMEAEQMNQLFGYEDSGKKEKDGQKKKAYAGAVSFGEAKLLAWPVRSLKGCFAWVACPLALHRFARDTQKELKIPEVKTDACFAPADVTSNSVVVLEEYPLSVASRDEYGKLKDDIDRMVAELKNVSNDPVWHNDLEKRLVIVSDENFQHLVTTTTEIVARISIDPKTRTNKHLFNQENAPAETVYYSVCSYLGERTKEAEKVASYRAFEAMFTNDVAYIQFGGNETIGLGLCEVKKSVIGGE